MDLYSLLREIADSWGLLAFFTFFVGMAIWVFRPGSRALHDEAAQLAFNDDHAPPPAACANACPDCTCDHGASDRGQRNSK